MACIAHVIIYMSATKHQSLDISTPFTFSQKPDAFFQVAQHLAKSYGDRAFAVAKMAAMTGKRWPIIGKKMHPEFPYIDAEIRYLFYAGQL